MINKEELGLRIRQEREKQGLSREALCGDEAELTVRQLLRIETGKSLPKLEKLEFLSRVLGVDISTFLGEEKLELPEGYIDKKYRLLKISTYGDPDRIEMKRKMLEEIYEVYYDSLPEEELFTLDLLERIWDIASGVDLSEAMAADIVYEDYFRQLQVKQRYSSNDLMLLSYHYFFSHKFEFDKKLFDQLSKKLLKQKTKGDEVYNRELLNALLLLVSAYVSNQSYSDLLRLTDHIEKVIDETMQHSFKPLLLLTKAKYYMFFEKNQEKASQFYRETKQLGELLGDKAFLKQLDLEIKKDLKQKEE